MKKENRERTQRRDITTMKTSRKNIERELNEETGKQ